MTYPIELQPGNAVWELLDVGIPLAWAQNCDLICALNRNLPGIIDCVDEDKILKPRVGEQGFWLQVQDVKIAFYGVDMPHVVYEIKKTIFEELTIGLDVSKPDGGKYSPSLVNANPLAKMSKGNNIYDTEY